MTETSLLTIGAFARSVGLTPSALRFYDDSGLLTPAVVDDRTGYRYYAEVQRDRAVLVRQLRELEVPLTTMRTVLDAGPAEAEDLLREHVDRLRERADRADTSVENILASLRTGEQERPSESTRFTIDGADLAGAIRQVTPFAAAVVDDADLACLLFDVADGELAVVATDRYRLAARTLAIGRLDGPARRFALAPDGLNALEDWARRRRRVTVTAPEPADPARSSDRSGGLTVVDQQHPADRRVLALRPDRFPDHRMLFDSLAEQTAGTRLIVDRIALLRLVSLDTSATIVISSGADHLLVWRLEDPERHRVQAVCSGAPITLAFAPDLLATALQGSVGPDVLIDAAPGRAAVVRSADQGGFSTLVMPRSLDDGGPVSRS